MSTIRDVLKSKESTAIHAVAPDTSILDAVGTMCRNRIGALLVELDLVPLGIISERDIMTRVMLAQRDPSTTVVSEVMTKELVCVGPDWEVRDAMALMTKERVRHLPTVELGIVVGIVSIGDLVRWASECQEYEIRTLREYVSGVYS